MRPRKFTVLAYGEGEDEKTFLRHLVACYCRSNLVSVQTGSAGGGAPSSILSKALRSRRGEKRDIEYILLDTEPPWPSDVIEKAKVEGILLLGNSPCLEALFFEILEPGFDSSSIKPGSCKKEFEHKYCAGNNFDEENCYRLFTKAILNEAQERIERLAYMVKSMDGSLIRNVT